MRDMLFGWCARLASCGSSRSLRRALVCVLLAGGVSLVSPSTFAEDSAPLSPSALGAKQTAKGKKPKTPPAAAPAPPAPKKKPEKKATPEAATPAAAAGAPGAPHDVVARESHIEFDERMIKGQTAAGAIYLFQRAPTEFKSIVTVPESFRPRTTALLLSRRSAP
jgi:hypothetical protein